MRIAGVRLGAPVARLLTLRGIRRNVLAERITMFELARIMGTSAEMIEAHHGTLIDTAHHPILSRLDGVLSG